MCSDRKLDIPGLKRESSQSCVSCGAGAVLFCAGCGITPYCAERCQREDWNTRHHSVCHNLARSTNKGKALLLANGGTDVPVTAPTRLRQPQSTATSRQRSPRDQPSPDSGYKREGKKIIPAAENHAADKQVQQRKSNLATNDNRSQQERSGQNRSHDANRWNKQGVQNEDIGQKNQAANSRLSTPNQYPPLRQPALPTPKSAEPQVTPKPESITPKIEPVKPKPEPVKPSIKPGSVDDVTPRKALTPATYMIEMLPVGASFFASVVSLAVDGTKRAGCICVTISEAFSSTYDQLVGDLKAKCLEDGKHFTPRIGELFAYLEEEEGDWYRARCLSQTRAALLDGGRVVSFTPSVCRRLPAPFANLPEFVAFLKTIQLTIDDTVICTVVSTTTNSLRVSIDAGAGKIVEVDATRWVPEVEYSEPESEPILDTQQKQATPELITEVPVEVEPSKVSELPKKASVMPSMMESRPEVYPLVPNTFVIGELPVGSKFVAETVSLNTESSQQTGTVCVIMHSSYEDAFNSLCMTFTEECLKEQQYTPSIGETFAYIDDDGFRARCLTPTRAALLDSATVVSFAPSACRRLPASFKNVPEFAALLKATNYPINITLHCTIVSSTPDVIRVSIDDDLSQSVELEFTRWIPEVQYPTESIFAQTHKVLPPPTVKPATVIPPVSKPVPKPVPKPETKSEPKPAPTGIIIPEVPRPPVEHNSLYILLDVTSLGRATVLPSLPHQSAAFDSVLQDTVLYGIHATPLTTSPKKGQTVVAQYSDGIHYRALVKRVNVVMNKYLIEYVEFGNEEIVPIERLYPCPPELQLDEKPAQASIVKLSERQPTQLTEEAVKYIDKLKDNKIELTLTIPGGAVSAPSGSLVNLVVTKNCELASKMIEELCTPEWVKLAEKGGDVLEVESRFYSQLEYLTVPLSRPFTLRVTSCDLNTLMNGAITGYEKGDKTADIVYGELTKQIALYTESSLCREPYLPKVEEMCIVRNKTVDKWVRSVLLNQPEGPGSETVRVLHVDYGSMEYVSVTDLRKMMPEFVDRYPAVAQHFEIKDFPRKVTMLQLESAMRLMKITAEGFGELRVASCREVEDNMYEMEAPELIAALTE